MAAIESGATRFDTPHPDPESAEPPFLEEWLEAQQSFQVLGQSCLAIVAATLHLCLEYLDALYVRGRAATSPSGNWLKGYEKIFLQQCNVSMASGPADLALLEEVVLARNSTQHIDSITYIAAPYRSSDLARYPKPTFISESERELLARLPSSESALLLPTIEVSAEALETVLLQVENFSDWLEQQLALSACRRR
ncbi:MAG TPA: hypothetical protein VF522_18090 [Ramlibacter sp.]|uniref:hypothetical protein n=1 Tax=Ramlibacter sp. TaxID=1917967 RepID=UPI002ED04F6F